MLSANQSHYIICQSHAVATIPFVIGHGNRPLAQGYFCLLAMFSRVTFLVSKKSALHVGQHVTLFLHLMQMLWPFVHRCSDQGVIPDLSIGLFVAHLRAPSFLGDRTFDSGAQ